MQPSDLEARDRRSLWHPYTQHGQTPPIQGVNAARGAYLTLDDGRQVIDAVSSWWVNIHGHGQPDIVAAIARQAAELEHVIFAGFTHEPAVNLAESLLEAAGRAGTKLSKVFYSDNGSTAVEVALKMAFQYQTLTGKGERPRFLALKGAYHGDTFGAMAVGARGGFHAAFEKLLFEVDFVEPGDLASFSKLIDKYSYAAFIFEPLIQGAAGMRIYNADFLRKAVALCRAQGVLTIADEVFTGFYRTGRFFAFETAKISPDLVCLSKGLTGGFMPLAATLATESIFEAFLDVDLRKAFLHGHSYTANPIACAAANASMKLLQSEECQENIRRICERTHFWAEELESDSALVARALGTIGAAEPRSDKGNYFSGKGAAITQMALSQGVLLRPLGSVLYVVPPYCLTTSELDHCYKTLWEIFKHAFS